MKRNFNETSDTNKKQKQEVETSFYLYSKLPKETIQLISKKGEIIENLDDALKKNNVFCICKHKDYIIVKSFNFPFKFISPIYFYQKTKDLESSVITLPLQKQVYCYYGDNSTQNKDFLVKYGATLLELFTPNRVGRSTVVVDEDYASKNEITLDIIKYHDIIKLKDVKNRIENWLKYEELDEKEKEIFDTCECNRIKPSYFQKYFPHRMTPIRKDKIFTKLEYKPLDFNENQKRKLSKELLAKIFIYLPPKYHLEMRILSKEFSGYNDFYWKLINEKNIKNLGIPKETFKKVKGEYKDEFTFFHERISPLSKDIKIGGKYLENEKDRKLKLLFNLIPAKKRIKGQSRFGGYPDIPPNMKWDDKSFVFQLNFADPELHKTFSFHESKLPRKGILYVFMTHQNQIANHFFYDGDVNELVEIDQSPAFIDVNPMMEFQFIDTFQQRNCKNINELYAIDDEVIYFVKIQPPLRFEDVLEQIAIIRTDDDEESICLKIDDENSEIELDLK